MNLVDLLGIGVALLYVVLGLTTGTVRRVLGLVIVYVALLVGTNLGQSGGGIYQQWSPTTPQQDARLVGFLFFFGLIVVALEAAAFALRTQLQLAVVALDRFFGVAVGLVTAGVLVVALFYMGAGYGRAAVNEPSQLQAGTRDALSQSHLVLPLVKLAAAPVLPLLAGVLPRDSQAYFTFDNTH